MRVVGFFCEDIREEKAGTESVIGILPDNMSLPSVPGMIPKLAIYIRAQFELTEQPQAISARIDTPWGETIAIGEANVDLIRGAQQQASQMGLSIAGVILRAIMAPFPIRAAGLITAVATVGNAEHICAVMYTRLPSNPASSASPPPSSQSPPDAPAS